MAREVRMIVAAAENNGIGINNQLPWRIRKDMQYFKEITTNFNRKSNSPLNVCIMGRKTWDSIPSQYKPLPGRINIVLSRSRQESNENVIFCSSIADAMEQATKMNAPSIWIIGGSELYKLATKYCTQIFITRVFPQNNIEFDAYFDVKMEDFEKASADEFMELTNGQVSEIQTEGKFQFQFQIWNRKQ